MMEEMNKFQGTWKQIAYEKDGVRDPLDEQGWEPRVTFVGDTFIVTLADGTYHFTAQATDRHQKEPLVNQQRQRLPLAPNGRSRD